MWNLQAVAGKFGGGGVNQGENILVDVVSMVTFVDWQLLLGKQHP